jgi:methionine sulfoxide reductase heme-binding subunit
MTAVDLSSYAGLTVMVLLTLNILLGLVLSTRYDLPARWWPYGRRRIFDIHNWTAYIALGLITLHPVLLQSSATAKFHFVDLLLPLNSPGQTLITVSAPWPFAGEVIILCVGLYLRFKLSYRENGRNRTPLSGRCSC